MENLPVCKDLNEIIKFSEKLRKDNKGNLAEALFIFDDSTRLKILYKMSLTEEGGFSLSFEKDLVPKKNLKYVKNKETGEMELDFC